MQEYRGVSFSIGGDPGAITLPNLINSVKSTVKLVGPSVGSLAQPQLKTTCTGADVEHVCRLNAAVDGSDLQDLRDLQVGYLRDTLSNAPWAANISISKDWKLLTIFSGLDDVVFYNATDPTKQSTNTTLFAANLDHLLQARLGKDRGGVNDSYWWRGCVHASAINSRLSVKRILYMHELCAPCIPCLSCAP